MKEMILLVAALMIPAASFATTAEDVKQKTSEAATTASNYTKEQKDKYQAEMKTKLDHMKQDLAQMKKDAAKKSAAAKQDMQQEISKLEKKQNDMKQSLAKLEKSSGKAWDEMKDGMSKSWDDLSTSYESAKQKFKEEK